MLATRIAADKPVRVGLIGAGKFGSMFLAQVPSIAGLDVAAISDLDPERAKAACRTVGWDAGRIARTRFTEHGRDALVDAYVAPVFAKARARDACCVPADVAACSPGALGIKIGDRRHV